MFRSANGLVGRFSVVAVLLGSTAFACAAGQSSARKVIEQMNKQYAQALIKKNIGWFEKTLAPDFFTLINERSDPAATLKTYQNGFGDWNALSVTTKIVSLKEEKKGVTVVQETQFVIWNLTGPEAGKKGNF